MFINTFMTGPNVVKPYIYIIDVAQVFFSRSSHLTRCSTPHGSTRDRNTKYALDVCHIWYSTVFPSYVVSNIVPKPVLPSTHGSVREGYIFSLSVRNRGGARPMDLGGCPPLHWTWDWTGGSPQKTWDWTGGSPHQHDIWWTDLDLVGGRPQLEVTPEVNL